MGGRHQPGKGNRQPFMERNPPMPPVERRNRRAIEEREPMKIGKHLGDVVVLRIDLPYSVHRMSSFAARELGGESAPA